MSDAEAFARLMREETELLDTMSYSVRRSGYWPAWRWTVVMRMGGVLVDETLCLTRRGAERKGLRWVAAEREFRMRALRSVEAGLVP